MNENFARQIEDAMNRDLAETFPNARLNHRHTTDVPPLKQFANVLEYARTVTLSMQKLEAALTGEQLVTETVDDEPPEGYFPQLADLASRIGTELQRIERSIEQVTKCL